MPQDVTHTQTFYAQCAFDFHCFLDDSLLYLGSCDQKEICTVTCPSHAYLSIRAWLKRIGWIVQFDSTKLNLKYDTAKSMPITLSLDRKKGSLSAMPSFWLREIEEFITRFMIAPRPCKKHVRATELLQTCTSTSCDQKGDLHHVFGSEQCVTSLINTRNVPCMPTQSC